MHQLNAAFDVNTGGLQPMVEDKQSALCLQTTHNKEPSRDLQALSYLHILVAYLTPIPSAGLLQWRHRSSGAGMVQQAGRVL